MHKNCKLALAILCSESASRLHLTVIDKTDSSFIMEQLKNAIDIARYLYCTSIVEGRVANAYKHLHDRTTNPQIKSLLEYILHDTTKHSAILRNLAGTIAKQQTKIEDC